MVSGGTREEAFGKKWAGNSEDGWTAHLQRILLSWINNRAQPLPLAQSKLLGVGVGGLVLGPSFTKTGRTRLISYKALSNY